MKENTTPTDQLPTDFIWRRLHSLTGLWLVLFLIVHLFTNAQAALPIGEDGIGFIHAVNQIHDTPFLRIVELSLLAIPILIHMAWGIRYLRTAAYNSFGNSGRTPYLPDNPRNRAYTWQRITSWILLFGIIAHVVQMRFIDYPTIEGAGPHKTYSVQISMDEGLKPLSQRLEFKLYTSKEDRNIPKGKAVAVTDSFGKAELLLVRDTFKMPLMLALYTIFVLSACFHGFNGLWTAMISWGITLTARSQRLMRIFCIILMAGVTLLGLSAIWLTYWVNLKG